MDPFKGTFQSDSNLSSIFDIFRGLDSIHFCLFTWLMSIKNDLRNYYKT